MTWKGTMRSIQAAQRRQERESLRRQKELEKQQKQFEKMQELERATYEVEVYENHIDVLLSAHKECDEPVDWVSLKNAEAPSKPVKLDKRQIDAQAKSDNYKPSFLDKSLRRTESQKAKLVSEVEKAKELDETEYKDTLKSYEENFTYWQESREIASKVLNGDPQSYIDVIEQFEPFSDLNQLGSQINFQVDEKALIEVVLHVNDDASIPNEAKSLLKSGKLSVKKMPKTKFFELYQDHVCSCILRVGRELIALLPVDMVIVTAMGNLLNLKTGHMEEQPILSVLLPRKTLKGLNFNLIDPSDSMDNFVHRMSFKKTKGFEVIEPLTPEDISTG